MRRSTVGRRIPELPRLRAILKYPLEASTVPESLAGPTDLVLPRIEKIARQPKIRFVMLPDMFANVYDTCAAAISLERVDDPIHQNLTLNHSRLHIARINA